MSYLRFWWRSAVVFAPIFFIVLYFGAHLSLVTALLSILVITFGGLLLMAPILLSLGRVDRTLWSEEAHEERQKRYQEKLKEWEEQ